MTSLVDIRINRLFGEEENRITMSFLPDELWRRILELGIGASNWNYKDLCCISITCRRFNLLSGENQLWSYLVSSDFPHSSSAVTDSNLKSVYKLRFERDKQCKILAHRRAVLRIESQIAEHSRKIKDLQQKAAIESEKLHAAKIELSNLHRIKQASTALNVWQPEIIHGRHTQIVEQSAVPADYRIHALQMEVKLCRQQISSFDKAKRDESRRLDEANEKLATVKYHPLQIYNSNSNADDGKLRGIKRKKSKKLSDC